MEAREPRSILPVCAVSWALFLPAPLLSFFVGPSRPGTYAPLFLVAAGMILVGVLLGVGAALTALVRLRRGRDTHDEWMGLVLDIAPLLLVGFLAAAFAVGHVLERAGPAAKTHAAHETPSGS